MPSPAPAPIEPFPELWHEIEDAFSNPEMVDEDDSAPSREALATVKRVLEGAQEIRKTPVPHPHIEFFDGSIRLIWTRPEANIRLVIASSDERQSYLYHEDVENGLAANFGTVQPTSSNLAHWLNVMESQDRTAQS